MNVDSYLVYLRGALVAALLTGLAFGLSFAIAFFLGANLEGDLTLDVELGGFDGLWFLVLAPLAFGLVFLVLSPVAYLLLRLSGLARSNSIAQAHARETDSP
mgnify:CR=1 FL=1